MATAHQGVAARFGGDELCLLLPAESLEPAGQIAEEVRARIDRIKLPVDGSGQPLGITASVGVASYPEHAPTVDGLLAAADVAVYDAKLEGRNRTWMASPPGVREALKLESAELASQSGPSAVPRDVADPELNGNRSKVPPSRSTSRRPSGARSRLAAACAGTVCAGAVLVGALSSNAAIPSFLWFTVPLVGGLPLLMLWVAEKQYLDRSRATRHRAAHRPTTSSRRPTRACAACSTTTGSCSGRMHRSYISTITSLARTVEAKDPLHQRPYRAGRRHRGRPAPGARLRRVAAGRASRSARSSTTSARSGSPTRSCSSRARSTRRRSR